MMKKFLLIGIGGSGGQTLRFAHHELSLRLRAKGWTSGIPAGWQFLHIDVPENADGYGPGVPPVLNAPPEYLGLAKFPRNYAVHDQELCVEGVLPGMVGWRPDPTAAESRPIWQGAGKRRAIGRVVALNNLNKVASAVDDALTAMQSSTAQGELQALAGLLKARDDLDPQRAGRAIIVSSLSGGAGSGGFLDIVELLRSRANAANAPQWLPWAMTFLYAPDVFGGGGFESGLHGNSLGALSELLSAFEHTGPIHADEQALLERGGGAALEGRRSMLYNMIIGKENESGVSFADEIAVFRAVGKAVATFMANPMVQSEFDQYLTANWDGPVAELGFSSSRSHENPCSSMGYANVGLGFRLFGEYSSQRLARAAIERLLNGHERLRERDDRRPSDVIVRERAGQLRVRFFSDAGLYELNDSGEEHDDVVNALLDRAAVEQRLSNIKLELDAEFAKSREKRTPVEWATAVRDRVEARRQRFAAETQALRVTKAQAWVAEAPRRLADVTAEVLGQEGFDVTIQLLDLLSDQVRDAANELRTEVKSLESSVTKAFKNIEDFFLKVREKALNTSHSTFASALGEGVRGLTGEEKVRVRELAATLLDDFRTGVIPALREALVAAQEELKYAYTNGITADEIASWPIDVVPPALQPAPNEIFLNKVDTFPGLFAEKLEQTLDRPLLDAESGAITEIVSGTWPADAGEDSPKRRRLLIFTQDWQCADNTVRLPEYSPQKAVATLKLDPQTEDARSSTTPSALLKRSEEWVRGRRGEFSRTHTATLGEYLAAADKARADQFVQALARALDAARPLVRLNDKAMPLVHPQHEPGMTVAMDQLPIPVGHPARAGCEELLRRFGVAANRIPGKFDETVRLSEVEIATFLDGSVSPLAFASLLAPINVDWNRARLISGERRRFWELRRARPLRSFVPLSPDSQEALVEGWLVARLLGQVKIDAFGDSGEGCSIWTPAGWRKFPRYLLGEHPLNEQEVLPALLESFPLVLLAVSSGRTEERDAYRRLFDLGFKELPATGADGLAPAAEESAQLGTDSDEFEQWVGKGLVPDGAPNPDPAVAGPGEGLAVDRAEALVKNLRETQERYAALRARVVNDEFTLKPIRSWEIKDLVFQAALDLERRARIAESRSTGYLQRAGQPGQAPQF